MECEICRLLSLKYLGRKISRTYYHLAHTYYKVKEILNNINLTLVMKGNTQTTVKIFEGQLIYFQENLVKELPDSDYQK